MVLWGLAGWMEGDTLVTLAGQAGTTALRYPLSDMGFRFAFFYDSIDAKSRAADIYHYVHAAAAAEHLRTKRILSIGYRDMNLYGTLYEGISLRKTIGLEVENREMLEMVKRSESVARSEIDEVLAYIKKNWNFDTPVDDAVLGTAAAYYRAVEQMSKEEGYEAVTIIDVDGVKKHLGFPPAAVFMLLTDRTGLCTVPENDIMGAVTQLIVKELTGQAAAYLEFYEFMSDRVLIGVPDFVPAAVCEGGVRVTGASFGNLGAGVLNISKVKTGPVTLCRCVFSEGKYYMHLETGTAVEPRKWKEAGWDSDIQLPSLEVILDNPVEEFAKKVCSQHTIIAYGDQRGLIEDYCKITGIEIMQ
jgi:L-fucose isomerase-like protein